jgi:tetratricopeptide (TPR) repeat protein
MKVPHPRIHPQAISVAAKLERANAFHQRGQLLEARTVYEEILDLHPKNFDALHLLGVVAAQMQNPRKAANLIAKAIKINPGLPAPHCNLGIALHELEKFEAALASFDKALELRPDYAVALCNRGHVLKTLRRLPAALASYDRAITLKPDLAEAHANRGAVQCALKQWHAALASFDRAVALQPHSAEVRFNRGNVLKELGRLEAAVSSYDSAIAINPDYAEAYLNRGFVLKELMRWEEASANFDRAIVARPDFAEAYLNRATTALLQGQLARGWRDYEWRWKNPAGPNAAELRHFRQPLWLGQESIAGATILLHAEQGLGDTLQFCRYVKQVAALGTMVILEVQEPLVNLLQRLEGVSRVIARGAVLPEFDRHCPLLSLPLAFDTTLASIPGTTPYLHADPRKVAHWRRLLGSTPKPRIGFAWSGNSRQVNDRNRSIRLADLIGYLPANLDYLCLQKEISAGDRRILADHANISIVSDALVDFSDTAAVCECADLVVSVDTSVAHLSAALGKRTWILLSSNPDWRWMLNRDDSPWYPTATLYRQPSKGDWGSVLARLRRDLLEFRIGPCTWPG